MVGFLPCSVAQILEADELIWQQLSKRARGGIRRRGGAATPLDLLVPVVMSSLDIQMALMPRQGNAAPPKQLAITAGDNSTKLIAALQRQIEDVRASTVRNAFNGAAPSAPKPLKDKPGKPGLDAKGKLGKAAKASGGSSLKPPPALAGAAVRSSVATGSVRMCFAYNLGTCKSKGDCAKGAHLCMKMLKSGEACSKTSCYASTCTR